MRPAHGGVAGGRRGQPGGLAQGRRTRAARLEVPEEYGGLGIRDFRYSVVIAEEIAATGTRHRPGAAQRHGGALPDRPDHARAEKTVAARLRHRRAAWSRSRCPNPAPAPTSSRIRATARRDGDHYILNGTKTFISNGILADLVIVVARTDPEAGHRGMSLLVVEVACAGFERGRKLDKIGQHAPRTPPSCSSPTSACPPANLLGEEGRGFYHLMRNLPQERLGIAIVRDRPRSPRVRADHEYARDRKAFGRPIGAFQVNRFAIAEMNDQARHRAASTSTGASRPSTTAS